MAEVRISKIQVRQGNMADLPILSPGELGYALDETRLFIGNSEQSVGTGDGNVATFPIGNSVNYQSTNHPTVLNPSFYYDGVQVNGTSYTINGSFVTFNTAPANGVVITMKYNTELAVNGSGITPGSDDLVASAPAGTEANFGFDTNLYDTAFIDYSIKLGSGAAYRIGTLRILIDNVADTYYIDDQYNTLTGDVDVTFEGDITNDIFTLTYTNNETSQATFYYSYKLWKM